MGKSGFIAVIGRPNVGKSTLTNKILGEPISIVTPKAQTTRERILAILTEPRGQIVFVDTPGIHRAKVGGINQAMVQATARALNNELIWYLVDPRSALFHEEVVLDLFAQTIQKSRIKSIFLVMNKIDLEKPSRLRELAESIEAAARTKGILFCERHLISAQRGDGIETLLESSWRLLPEGPLLYPDTEALSDRPTRFFVAERIREQLFLQLGEELPYCCAVKIESYDEGAQLSRIEASIYVEKESQKPIVIGKAGSKIKSIGQAARHQIEVFLGQKIFLGLKVKVLKDWTKSAEKLKQLGYLIEDK